ncbi:MAG: ATP-binding protein [Acidobacteriota bacterium]
MNLLRAIEDTAFSIWVRESGSLWSYPTLIFLHSCRIAVIDNGPGIPPEVRSRLFTPFVTTKSRGTGLGLSTVKRWWRRIGGEVLVDCPAEGGTTVVVTLPLPPP